MKRRPIHDHLVVPRKPLSELYARDSGVLSNPHNKALLSQLLSSLLVDPNRELPAGESLHPMALKMYRAMLSGEGNLLDGAGLEKHRQVLLARPEEGILQRIVNSSKGPLDVTKFVGPKSPPMIDIDVPDKVHLDESVTAKGYGDAFSQIEKFVRDGNSHVQRVYLTPGGIRSFAVSEPGDENWLVGKNIGDPLYKKLSMSPEPPHSEGASTIPPGFNVRTGPKANRTDIEADWVAGLLGTISRKNSAPANPTLIDKIRRFHDGRIRDVLSYENPIKAKAAFLKALLENLHNMPKSLADQARRRHLHPEGG